jgi:hypothetical protein
VPRPVYRLTEVSPETMFCSIVTETWWNALPALIRSHFCRQALRPWRSLAAQ